MGVIWCFVTPSLDIYFFTTCVFERHIFFAIITYISSKVVIWLGTCYLTSCKQYISTLFMTRTSKQTRIHVGI
jgi:hypothetical protein